MQIAGPDRQSVMHPGSRDRLGRSRTCRSRTSFFFTTAAIVLVVSFVLLGLPLETAAARAARGGTAGCRAALSAVPPLDARCGSSVQIGRRCGCSVVTLATALFGDEDRALELRADLRSTSIFWLGRPAALDPVRERVARAQPVARDRRRDACGALERGGREARPVLDVAGRVGAGIRPPPRSSPSSRSSSPTRGPPYPRTLAIAIGALHRTGRCAGMAVYGREAWTRGGEGFAVAFELLCADCAVRGARRSASSSAGRSRGSPAPSPSAGRSPFVAVMLGSTSFDGVQPHEHAGRT